MAFPFRECDFAKPEALNYQNFYMDPPEDKLCVPSPEPLARSHPRALTLTDCG